jgi:hypothetical protein
VKDLEPVRAALWDVRAQWESGVRRLSTTQSSLEKWQSVRDPTDRDHAVVNVLSNHIQALKEINRTVKALLDDVERALG